MKTNMRTTTRKLVFTAMPACLAFVLNTCVYFPAMAPFHTPSAIVVAAMGTAVLLIFKQSGLLNRMLNELHGGES